MNFRCPNCHQAIRVDNEELTADERTVDAVTCPSCNSRFSFSADVETTVRPALGITVEHFELRELLGEGSFGTVYKAWDKELERFVAVKIPRPGTVTEATSKQFVREARYAAGVSHPNVVGVHEIGQYQDSFYIATQLIDGVSLLELRQARQFTQRQSAELMIPLLRGIQAFHDRGIIHRDLKPGNILVDTAGIPYVADFGLARRDQPSELTVTQSGKIVGTIAYMSPEQARGEVSGLSNRSDIFSMGVILYELLTGRRPFEATGSRTVLYRILTEDAPKPRGASHRISRDLQTICMKALRKEPPNRYESAGEMADDLQRFLDGRPITARPVSLPEKAWKLIRRNRLLSAAVSITTISMLVALVTMLQPSSATVPVVVNIENGDADLHFVRYDDVLRVPHASHFEVRSVSGGQAWLTPGLYRVHAKDSTGRRHEVWRTVPELPTTALGDQRYPHRSWTIEDGTVVLQPFQLFADKDVADSMVTINGGTIQIGLVPEAGDLAGYHQQTVEAMQVAVNEVSYKSFRSVMNQPLKSGSTSKTYLSEFQQQYGDRSEIPDEMPVSGYPIDVAIVYCELAGGRLPSCIEWEFVATLGGTSPYSSGSEPPLANLDEIQIKLVSSATSDTTPSGIRNLCSSVAEYTDSRCFSYAVLYPSSFASPPAMSTSREDLLRLPELVEVRGAPGDWIATGSTTSMVNPRDRHTAPLPPADTEAAKVYGRIGWRMMRSLD